MQDAGAEVKPTTVPTQEKPVPPVEAAALRTVDEIVSNPIAQMGVQYALNQTEGIEQKIKQGISGYFDSLNLKYYFSVDEGYVMRKCKLILCPIFYKGPWKRRTIKVEGQDAFLPPKQDLNAPDLYVPTMAFLTYVLTAAVILGTKNQFHPESLSKIASTGLISLGFEVVFLKLGFYLLNSFNTTVMDLLAYSGYIFVPISFNHIVALLLGPFFFYISSLITGTFAATFIVKTLRLIVLPDQPAQGALPSKRNYFVLSMALLQLVFAFFLGFC